MNTNSDRRPSHDSTGSGGQHGEHLGSIHLQYSPLQCVAAMQRGARDLLREEIETRRRQARPVRMLVNLLPAMNTLCDLLAQAVARDEQQEGGAS